MNLASNYVAILCYHASTIVQSFLQELAQNGLEMLPGYWNQLYETIFPSFQSFPFCFSFTAITLLLQWSENHTIYGPRWFQLAYFEFNVISN